jgi:hypothetical protein
MTVTRPPLSSPPSIVATLLSMALWIGAAICLSIACLVPARRLIPFEVLDESSNAVGNYLQTIGTIYAVLLAFVVFVVWQQFNDARGHVEREANEILDVMRVVKGLPENVWRPFLKNLHEYVCIVLEDEWPAMARGSKATFEAGTRILDRISSLLIAHEPESECHKSLYDEALGRFNDLSDARMNRLFSSRLRIPLGLRLLLYTGAAMTVGSMYLLAVKDFVIHATITALLAGAISHVLFLISDLDDAFSGTFQVPRIPFERVGRYLDEWLASPDAAQRAAERQS